MKILRTIFFWAIFVISTVVIAIPSILAGFIDRTGNTSHRLNRVWGRILLFASGSKVTIIGKENYNHIRNYLILSNHQSGFDIYTLFIALPGEWKFIAKEELFKIPFLGWAMTAARYISVKRENRRSAYDSIIHAASLGREGYSIVIFPEGTRSLDGKIQNFKKGALLILSRVEMEVLPVTIHGTFGIMPKGTFIVNPQKITVVISKPREWNRENSSISEAEFLNKLREDMINNFNGLG